MNDSLRVAIAGLGTVGSGTAKLLQAQAELHAMRTGTAIEIVAVSARSDKDRGFDRGRIDYVANTIELASRDDVDCVVELIGGDEGIARELVEAALGNGKHVVTANKALIAKHGLALATLAEENDVQLSYEAAVAGGIPIIGALRHGLAANAIESIAGILNGTGNYILTTMQKTGRDFDDVLKEAQDLGYAEADPTFDVDGIDTAHKLAILTTLCYGCAPDMGAITCEGIRSISAQDIAYAKELGYAIKLLGIAEKTDEGILQRVHPCMVPAESPLALTDGAFNAVHVKGSAVGSILLEGQGAGEGPTASSVVADILDIARDVRTAAFVQKAATLTKANVAPMASLRCAFYLRLNVNDEPGVLHAITGALADEGISVRAFLQKEHHENMPAQIVITTYETTEAAMQRALSIIETCEAVIASPQRIRMEDV